jgi:hypothetical protein
MEMHAHVPKLGHTLSHWVLEGVFITVSVLLGFWVNQVREEHQNRELAVRVLKGLEAEIKDNLATLEPFIDLHQKWIKSMSTMGSVTDQKIAFGVCPTTATACGAFFASRPPLGKLRTNVATLRRAAWDTALSTGALRLIDYNLAAGLSEIYQMQDLYKANVEKVGVGSSDWFDPRSRDAAFRKTAMAVLEVEYDERELILPLYKKYLPQLTAAIAHD